MEPGETIENLKSRIRDFEDKRISAAELGREVFRAARQIHGEGDSSLRRSLERLGNRLTALSEEGRTSAVRGRTIEVVDELIAQLNTEI